MSELAHARSGRLEGARSRGGFVFRGIPYAAPPLGALRFRAPQPVAPWREVRAATRFGASAPQTGAMNWLVARVVGAATGGQSEDCLTLNVWTPALDRRRRAVLVFVHGGAFVLGSGSTPLYSGSRLSARGDVVVVTLNYRLGALGSLALRDVLPDGSDSDANLGLRDQLAGLEWVRDNIDAFGGDPASVTVFGESAGAMSLGALLASPRARGLFRRAILQSGAAHNVSSPAQARRVAEEFVARLGKAGESLARLRAAPPLDLLRAQADTGAALARELGGLAFQPSVDGDVLPEAPLTALARGAASEVALLAGTNAEEWKLFMLGDLRARSMDEDMLRRRFARSLGDAHVERAFAAYARAPLARAPEAPHERWSAFQSDRVFTWPATRLLDLHASHSRETYAYRFNWAPPLAGGRIGACHGMELPFVFGAILEPWLRPVVGVAPGARKLAHRVQEAWLAFAKTGHPGHSGLPYWPPYDGEKRQAMQLGRRCAAFPDYGRDAARFWQSCESA
ncbi:MAG TPA: carboxylesterase/lipase family protein [Myxococcota bacterium]|nr:carboxylesterase/lipase family protein [Myxococcota bacterium]